MGVSDPQPPAALRPGKYAVLVLLLKMQAVYVAIALVWGLVRGIPWWTRFSLSPWLGVGVVVGLLLALASHYLFGHLARSGWDSVRWLRESVMRPIALALPPGGKVLVSLASGFCEEILFRGILLSELGLYVSSLLFALLHLGDRRMVWMAGWAMMTGLLMGGLTLLTGNLGVAVAVHVTNNYASFWLLQHGRREQ